MRTRILDGFWVVDERTQAGHFQAARDYILAWWLRPAILIVAVPLLVLIIMDIQRDVMTILYRLVGFVAIFAFIYGPRRKPRGRRHRR